MAKRKSLASLAAGAAKSIANAIRGVGNRQGGRTDRTPSPTSSQGLVTFGNSVNRDRWVREEQNHEAVASWANQLAADGATGATIRKWLSQYGHVGILLGEMLNGGRKLSGEMLEAAAKLITFFRGRRPPMESDPEFQKAVQHAERVARQVATPPPSRLKKDPRASESDRVQAAEQDQAPEFSPLYQTPKSSNVWSFQYRYSTSTLYVRFKAPTLNSSAVETAKSAGGLVSHRGQLGKTITGKSKEPGALYAYYDVPVRVFERLVKSISSSAGKAVWDNLRIRGTVYGHQFRYGLAEGAMVPGEKGRSGLYVPRRATKEGFRRRSVVMPGTGRRPHAGSTLPEQLRPNRGDPDRGRTWQARRFRGGGG